MPAKKTTTISPRKKTPATRAPHYARAEQACQRVQQLFDQWLENGKFGEQETAAQYARMCAVYYKKIRNGQVLSPGDFNLAVDVCTAARRALQTLDDSLTFADHPQTDVVQALLQQLDGVLADFQKLKSKPGK